MHLPIRGGVSAGVALALALGLSACDKKPGPPAPPKPAPQVVAVTSLAPHPSIPTDPALTPAQAAVQLANQMDRGDAARCAPVFAVVGDMLKKSGKTDPAKEAASYLQAANYLLNLPMPGHAEPPKYPEIQAAVTRESKAWTPDQRNANFTYCRSQFQNLHSLLDAAGELKKKK